MKSLVETQMDQKEKTNLVQFIYFEMAQKYDKISKLFSDASMLNFKSNLEISSHFNDLLKMYEFFFKIMMKMIRKKFVKV